jgi:hypothetical protein
MKEIDSIELTHHSPSSFGQNIVKELFAELAKKKVKSFIKLKKSLNIYPSVHFVGPKALKMITFDLNEDFVPSILINLILALDT